MIQHPNIRFHLPTTRTLPILLLTLLIFTGIAPLTHAADNHKPNIILCMADDQGWGDVAYNGHPVLKTPHLDAMSKAGLRFDQFYAAAPVCSPTRGSVMTGRHPNRFGCFSWGNTLRPQEITIAEALKKAGYTTGHFGKWHIGSVRDTSPVNPKNSGFDTYLSAPNFYDNDPILSKNGTATKMKGESSIVTADAAIDFIKEQSAKNKPFLAVVWFGSPHVPHRAVSKDKAHYTNLPDEHAKRFNKRKDWLGEITGLDRAVGKLRSTLKELNIKDNTLFWYCSDNGGLYNDSAGGRMKKGSIYEGGLRVPSIIEWPNGIKQPFTTQIPTNTVDIYPTLLDIVGIKMDNQPPLDGQSLKPLILNGKGGQASFQRNHPMGFWSYSRRGISTPSAKWMAELYEAQQNGNRLGDKARLRLDAAQITQQYPDNQFPGHAAWLDYPYKLHRIQKNQKGKQVITYELYNLEKDPMEKNNLAPQQQPRVEKMQTELNQWLQSVVNSLNGKDYN